MSSPTAYQQLYEQSMSSPTAYQQLYEQSNSTTDQIPSRNQPKLILKQYTIVPCAVETVFI